MKKDILSFIFLCMGILGIKCPVDIRMRTKDSNKETKDNAGFADTHSRNGKIIRHVIFINIPVCIESNYSLESVIAHELAHSIMYENETFDNSHHHNKIFQNWCKYLEHELLTEGYNIGSLYNPETDTE